MKKVNIAVVGVGGIGRSHLSAAAASPLTDRVYVCDTDEGIAASRAAEYGAAGVYTNYAEMLRNREIDGVIIATPDQIHREQVVSALEAGKDVLCEKPLGLDAAECRDMIDTAHRCGHRLMVGQVCRMTPSFRKAKKLVDAGEIGELYFVESEYAHDYSDMPPHWRQDPVRVRHPVTGGGCHAVDLLRWIAGDPTEVYACTNKKVLLDWPVDDSAIAVLKFPHNVMGKVFVSTGSRRAYTMRTVLYGTGGTIIVDNTSATLSLFKRSLFGQTEYFGMKMETLEIRIPVSTNSHNVAAEVGEFCGAMTEGRDVQIGGEEGFRTIAVCDAIIRSAASGMPEAVEAL